VTISLFCVHLYSFGQAAEAKSTFYAPIQILLETEAWFLHIENSSLGEKKQDSRSVGNSIIRTHEQNNL
jgi:hypothetical protein